MILVTVTQAGGWHQTAPLVNGSTLADALDSIRYKVPPTAVLTIVRNGEILSNATPKATLFDKDNIIIQRAKKPVVKKN